MKQSVLLIDDEKDFCDLAKGRLSKKVMAFNCAHSIAEGEQRLEELHPDILLLDNDLPDGSGWKKASYIQKQYPNMRIILISAFDPLTQEQTGLGMQFTRMSKPFNFGELEARLA